jgi:uncharacterized protein (DUF885 family)
MPRRFMLVAAAAVLLQAGCAGDPTPIDSRGAMAPVPAVAAGSDESRRLDGFVAWTDQAIANMREGVTRGYTAYSEARRVAETERYMAIPGQALAYKLGQLRISELRARAERELGARFDLRKFHSAILIDGPLPLDVPEARVDRWIAAEKEG